MAAGMLAQSRPQTRPATSGLGQDQPGAGLAGGDRAISKSAGLLERSGFALGFDIVGYGCTTCIGNSGPLARGPGPACARKPALAGCSVLSGNRNFEGRIHPQVYFNYLASPPLVVAWALAGRMDVDLENDPLGDGPRPGNPVFLRDIWPDAAEVQAEVARRMCSAGAVRRKGTPEYSTATSAGMRCESTSRRPPVFLG